MKLAAMMHTDFEFLWINFAKINFNFVTVSKFLKMQKSESQN